MKWNFDFILFLILRIVKCIISRGTELNSSELYFIILISIFNKICKQACKTF